MTPLVPGKPAFGASKSAGQAPGVPHWAHPPASRFVADARPQTKLPYSAHGSRRHRYSDSCCHVTVALRLACPYV